MATLIRIDRNGTKYYEGLVTCDRCGGAGGADAWKFTGWTCYKCNGKGKVYEKWVVRTPEYEAKLEARRAKRAEAKMAEFAAEAAAKAEEERKERELAEAKRKAEEEKLKAQKAISQFQGKVGDKITVDIVKHYTAHYDVKIAWKTETMFVHVMEDRDGNVYTWKTQKGLGYGLECDTNNWMYEKNGKRYTWYRIEENDSFTITGTVKEHNTYKDQKQTVLTRCKIVH